jgi:hypothetical protein
MANIRWRLLMGLASLGTTLLMTLPSHAGQLEAAAGKVLAAPGAAIADIWPNGAMVAGSSYDGGWTYGGGD